MSHHLVSAPRQVSFWLNAIFVKEQQGFLFGIGLATILVAEVLTLLVATWIVAGTIHRTTPRGHAGPNASPDHSSGRELLRRLGMVGHKVRPTLDVMRLDQHSYMMPLLLLVSSVSLDALTLLPWSSHRYCGWWITHHGHMQLPTLMLATP